MSAVKTKSAARAAGDWALALVPYRRASGARGVLELTVTFPPFVAIWTAMLLASRHGQFWLSFGLAPLAALFVFTADIPATPPDTRFGEKHRRAARPLR